MPQMMPLAWLTLYMYFIFMLLIFSFINYYSFISLPNMNNKLINSKSINWKW
uniref:ATP synthase F0 subunit 8 n=1 Tax=Paranauphoeta nigra TaxID=3035034 RepID=UPI0027A362EF|nr:ATP synthase F0 subunit 8 [Paranauphoeta nigra]WGO57447.1 ATP synthase F0 subunit 8 [Paranauphoeta nigra]